MASKVPTYVNWYRNLMGYRKYGLLADDLICSREGQMAARRLPLSLMNARQRRFKRAFDLSLKKQQLPKEQWTKPEEDVPYLTPYLMDVELEVNERVLWRDNIVGMPSWIQPEPDF